MPVEVTCSEACGADRVERRRRRSAGPATALGGAGSTYVFVRLSRATRARLARARTTRTTLVVTAVDASGNEARVRRTLRVAR